MRKRERGGNQEGNTQQQQERKRRGAERGNARVNITREKRRVYRLDTTPRHDEVEERAQADSSRTH